jgi:hypothetical protein
MTSGKTIFITYQFETGSFEEQKNYGYTSAIHCNYITILETDTLVGKDINFFFESLEDFSFMAGPSGITYGQNGYGWNGYKLYAIVQIVDGQITSGTTINPDPEAWKKIDVTNQIVNHVSGQTISPVNITQTVFTISQTEYFSAPTYNLDYLNIASALPIDDDKLSFGEETYFFGNIKTDIEAIAYSTDIAINLPLNQYNSTTNPTWDGNQPVQISEIGIYDDQGNLVAIGKLNYPIPKNSTVSRSILFQMDF